MPSVLLFVFVAALVKSVKQLNIYALRTFMLLTLSNHHKFKEICFCFFIVRPDLTFAIDTVVTLFVLGIANSCVFNITDTSKSIL